MYNRYNPYQGHMINSEDMYPEIYKIIYPMVKKICNRNNKIINKNLINELAEEIYKNIETEDREDRKKKRGSIFDLIKILIIRELLDNPPGNRPMPPRVPKPPRPMPRFY